ncbi:Diadenosine tetraphosphate hydrolase [Candidatus Phytoplasma australiense]|uniref:Diadenosine tetraphosphate hydrolase n=2 Tax=Phytoplasma australiense TaxID=59748 RepID=B1VAR6_PHYAS|nr:HIT family protein [Candidatus Phytoplasma australiense]AGL90456.1 Protein hit [Strawberry lethal yellows phytoplasma (CPA) str. NZSb11]CAM12039.1 Diadenosine tetraphosphate hydrolase [Candidatus Phytoplasma australiense]
MSTVFTKIIQKEIPSYPLYEDNLLIAFLDITQATKGHTLVVTKKEYRNIEEVPEEVFIHLFKIVHKISKALIKTFQLQGINLLNNNGSVAGQTVFHYHVHLLPRFCKKEIGVMLKNNANNLKISDYKKVQQAILMNL